MRINDIHFTTYKLRNFLDLLKEGKLSLNPNFQRRAVWTPTEKSFLIDSVVKNFPLPPILLREQIANPKEFSIKYEVVDGQQRLRTLLTFVDPKSFSDYSPDRDSFTVKQYHNATIAKKFFSELPTEIKNQILDYRLVCHELPSSVEDSEILEIFSRLNSTGVKLNPQELRNAAYFGDFKTTVYRLAAEQLSRWRKWQIFSESNLTRMQEDEFVSECLMLIIFGLIAKTQATINETYQKYDNELPNKVEIEKRFRLVMDEIDKKFGTYIPNSEFKRRILFFALFACFYEKMYGLKSDLSIKQKPAAIKRQWIESLKLKSDKLKEKTAPKDVLSSLKGQTNVLANRMKHYSYLLD